MELKVLCVHGVGHHPTGGPWEGLWRQAIEEPLARLDPEVRLSLEFVHLDDLFDRFEVAAVDVFEAVAKLGAGALDPVFRQPQALGDLVRWTAARVVQWVENDKLRKLTRQRVQQRITQFDPHLIVAHSLGSLICYDSFTAPGGAELVKGRRFVSAGSQIGNPFVVRHFAAGRLSPLEQADFWYHLYNPEDDVFTAEVRLSAPNFAQVDTCFDVAGPVDHDVTAYMRHPRTVATVWADAVMALRGQPLARRAAPTKAERQRLAKGPGRWATKPQRRALLVGVNEYVDPKDNLQGCVNDVYLMSALLQESGFAPEEIRVVVNERATCDGVRERLAWLLDDSQPGDTRFFYFSGHGAQIPLYGPGGQRVDRVQETLVLHDFDWTPERAFTDEQFHTLYSQLPYETRFIAMFDCCHSGGMTRASGRRIRGIDPPDDIRHRMLRWEPKHEMWVPRDFESPSPGFDKRFNPDRGESQVVATHRLGQAMSLRLPDEATLKREATARGHKGPYLPVLLHACRDDQFAYEYQHGPIAYGAFTYSLVKTLRGDRKRRGPRLSFEQLVGAVSEELKTLGYQQTPQLVAPTEVQTMAVPLRA